MCRSHLVYHAYHARIMLPHQLAYQGSLGGCASVRIVLCVSAGVSVAYRRGFGWCVSERIRALLEGLPYQGISWAYQECSLYQPKEGSRIVTYQERGLYHCVSVLYQWYHNGFAYHTSDSVRRCVSVFVSVCIMRISDEH